MRSNRERAQCANGAGSNPPSLDPKERRHGQGRPAGTVRHLVPAGTSIVKEHVPSRRARNVSDVGRTVYVKEGVIVGEESLAVNRDSSISIAERFASTSEAFLSEFKPSGIQVEIPSFKSGIQWIWTWNPLDSNLDHNASGLELADSKVEMNASPPESTESENETHWIRKPN